MPEMGPHEKKLRDALATADINPAISRSLGWTYSGFDLKWVGDALRDVAPKLADYGMTGSTPDSAHAAFLRLAQRVDLRWKDMEKAGNALSAAANAFWDADQVLTGNPATKTDPGAFTYDPNAADDQETQRLAHSGKAQAYTSEYNAREQKFAEALKAVDTAYLSSSQKLAEVHGLEPPPGLETGGGGTPASTTPASGPVTTPAGGAGTPTVGDPGPRDPGPRDPGPRDPGPRDPGPRDPGPRDAGPRDPGPRDPGPRDPGPPVVTREPGGDPAGPGGDSKHPTPAPGAPLGDPEGPQPGTYPPGTDTPGGHTPVGAGGSTPPASGPLPGLAGALGGGLIGGGAARMARGVGSVGGVRGVTAKPIGTTSRTGSAGALGRGGAAGATRGGAAGATRGGAAGATRGGAAGATRAAKGAAKGAGGSRGAAGGRGKAGGGGGATGQGRRNKDDKTANRDSLDSIAESSEWIDDDGAAPGVID